jgi:hypothetical protein
MNEMEIPAGIDPNILNYKTQNFGVLTHKDNFRRE